jgi:hypothetical protein
MFGVSAETVSRWVENGAPKIAHNRYDERLFVPWVIDMHKKRDTATLAEEQTRLTRHKADLAEIELAEKRAEVIPIATVRTVWDRVSTVIRSKFLTLSTITPEVVAAPTIHESQKVIEDAVWNILSELSSVRFVPSVEPDPAPTVDGEPMGRPAQNTKRRIKRGTRKVEHVES